LEERLESGSGDDDKLEYMVGVIESDLDKWKEWRKYGSLSAMRKRALAKLIADVELELERILGRNGE
jgi:hypothetical protein